MQVNIAAASQMIYRSFHISRLACRRGLLCLNDLGSAFEAGLPDCAGVLLAAQDNQVSRRVDIPRRIACGYAGSCAVFCDGSVAKATAAAAR